MSENRKVTSTRVDAESQWLKATGKRLQHAREDAGLMQEDVEQQIGIPVRTLTRWENGGSDPGFEKIARLAELYGVSTDWLAGQTTIQPRIKPGMVLIDDTALDVLEDIVAMITAFRHVERAMNHIWSAASSGERERKYASGYLRHLAVLGIAHLKDLHQRGDPEGFHASQLQEVRNALDND